VKIADGSAPADDKGAPGQPAEKPAAKAPEKSAGAVKK
jgi:hypothetical protein